ncbi:ATP-binding protein [Bifidobacterium imperatoris]|uniref:ATP-binding protein n=2 Tax=Bifidobacterium imperatoris TaxID=2020965 RepID=A0A2N5ISI9_9BIFI|nr:ATP-binding protein [Bifidobacterium imperatoris]PLS24938.1 ATPase [Bifidobacterium imperatoris]QSY58579.1 ATP-binding protein [Bifidobacterium imperatoris]
MVEKLQRTLMSDLETWQQQPNRKPLLLRGARQTGKTWIVSEFGRQAYSNVLRIDFMRDIEVRSLFEGNLNPNTILSNLSLYTGVNITPGKTLIFFDEIQECPRALTALKYFCEEAPEQHVIATGSYMGVSKHPDASFPVGKVNMLTLHPLTFLEYLENAGQPQLANLIRNGEIEQINSLFNDRLHNMLKQYLFVGGMPAAVAAHLNGSNAAEVRNIQREILDAYDLDFSKHAPARLVDRIRMVWHTLPAQLSKENRKFVYGVVRPGARARDFEESIMWLRDYGVIHQVYCASALREPLTSYTDTSTFKMFASDIGLLGALANLEPSVITQQNQIFTEFKGALTEQYVCQQLVADAFEPTYWANPNGRAEIDFSISNNGVIYPIEVKAEQNLHAKSLKYAYDHFELVHAIRASLAGYRDESWVANLPLWAINGLRSYLRRHYSDWAHAE